MLRPRSHRAKTCVSIGPFGTMAPGPLVNGDIVPKERVYQVLLDDYAWLVEHNFLCHVV